MKGTLHQNPLKERGAKNGLIVKKNRPGNWWDHALSSTVGIVLPAFTIRYLLRPFAYYRASTVGDAIGHLENRNSLPLGGGTDLLVFINEGLAAPDELVDLRGLPGSASISEHDGGLRLGASVRIQDIAHSALVGKLFPMLASSCASVGTIALRHMGTIGGNLCQRPRCWYFRRDIPCLKNGGDRCPAKEGENQYHAILGGGPCYIVHPSDPAVALTALDAEVEIAGPNGIRSVPIGEFYTLPSARLDRETVLETGEILIAIHVPGQAARGWQRYQKLMQRGSWDFALVSLAATRRVDGDVRLVLGGVAPRPWRVKQSIEEDVASGHIDLDDAATLADRALYDCSPLAGNGYKVTLAATLLRRAISAMLGEGGGDA